MYLVRVCICAACGHLTIRDVESDPMCSRCFNEDVEWMNVSSVDLEEDLEDAQATLADLIE